MNFDVEILLGGTPAHFRQRRFNHFHNRRYFDAGIGANDGDFLLSLFNRNVLNRIENELGDQGAVLAAAETDQPRARISKIKLPQ